jgi:hypothetical protein
MTTHRMPGTCSAHYVRRSRTYERRRPILNFLERLSEYTVGGTRAVLKSPLLLVGLMLLSLVIKLLTEPDDPGR